MGSAKMELRAELKFYGEGLGLGVSPGRCWGWDWTDWRGVKGGVGLPGRSRPGTHRMEASPAPWRPLAGGDASSQPA